MKVLSGFMVVLVVVFIALVGSAVLAILFGKLFDISKAMGGDDSDK